MIKNNIWEDFNGCDRPHSCTAVSNTYAYICTCIRKCNMNACGEEL